jgi:hypothetical protein
MRIGLFTLGLGSAADPDVIRAVAQTAERTGVAALWAAEHVVLFDRYDSAYPYPPNGAFPLGAEADWLDPFVTLTFAAAVTSRMRLATGICLVPEHNLDPSMPARSLRVSIGCSQRMDDHGRISRSSPLRTPSASEPTTCSATRAWDSARSCCSPPSLPIRGR